jgi:hypothetical protein
MKKLRIGTTNFEDIRLCGDYYADKTKFLYQIVRRRDPFFLSRPRRFGKTLLVNTLEHILLGHRELFKGLWIDGSDYLWTPYPVLRLEMNKAVGDDVASMRENLVDMLKDLAESADVVLETTKPANMLSRLIMRLHKKTGKTVAILIDEYDAPILEFINEPAKADKFRNALRRFYGVLKGQVGMIGHIFITGVSRFTKASIFSELNHLKDLTLDSKYAAICGLTEEDLEILLSEYEDQTLTALIKKGVMAHGSTGNDLRQLIHDWYDGYSWDGETKVFNPWSLLNFLDEAEIKDYWYQSGTPTFLTELVESGKFDYDWATEMNDFKESKNVINKISSIEPSVLLFQTGYLTIEKNQPILGGHFTFSLKIPNLEVEEAFVPLLLSVDPPENPLLAKRFAKRTRDHLLAMDAEGLQEAFSGYLAQYTYEQHINKEAFYHSMFESTLIMANQRFWHHEHTVHGRLDTHLNGPNGEEYIIEVKLLRERKTSKGHPKPPLEVEEQIKLRKKMATLAKEAFKQISENYAQTFLGDCRVIKVALIIARWSFVLAQFEVIEGKWS